jgi:hypothetical protein
LLKSRPQAVIRTDETAEFDEIYIEPDATPPVVLDGKADDVFDAIIKKRYRAIPFWDPGLVAAWLCAERWPHAPEDEASPRGRGPHRPTYPERSRRLIFRRGSRNT